MDQQDIYDLLIVVDATGSMTSYLNALNTSLPQIISISALTDCFSRIGLLAYRDYDSHRNLLEWSGWLSQTSDADHGQQQQQPDLVSMAKLLAPGGNGDTDEAIKTALAKAYKVMRSEATTVILLFTDAPPHIASQAPRLSSNCKREVDALSDPASYGGFGCNFVDWVSACKQLRNGDKRAIVFSILGPGLERQNLGHYEYLSTMTGGACLFLKTVNQEYISKVTVDVLLAWMGVEKSGLADAVRDERLPAKLSKYTRTDGMEDLVNEHDDLVDRFFVISYLAECSRDTFTRIEATPRILNDHLPKKKTPLPDFTTSWKNDPAYRLKAIAHLTKIIEEDVRAIALNPVFGTLWRAVCADRKTLDEASSLLSAFSTQVDRIHNQIDRENMKVWLEESYNYVAEVEETVNSVPETDRFPCVCLDPTLNFVQPNTMSNAAYDGESDKPITSFTRVELQEIGRSCDYKIMRRLGRILTQLSYFESASDMPTHIAAADSSKVPRIPMALASNEHDNQFWKVLLHVILPGTMLSARPAALLAALSLRLGVGPLTQVAEHEMLRFSDKWNNLENPETWNVGCLSLLLDADRAYRRRHDGSVDEPSGLLSETDRSIFERLVSFKMLQLNLDSPLNVRTGWKPDKSRVPFGQVVVCQSCHFPRSVTMMSSGGTCGLCMATDFVSPEDSQERIGNGVSKSDSELTPATWVECGVQSCRVQYVVYNPVHLNVRPKCHYCRVQGSLVAPQLAPCVECTKCLNRIIWPEEHRPPSFSSADFLCPACTSGHKTIIDIETTAKAISAENTTAWLVRDTEKPGKDPFTNRSLYHTVSAIGPDQFASRIHLFPELTTQLTLNGKPIHNTPALISTLQDLIARRKTGAVQCSLCFSSFTSTSLHPSCGRHGCHQRICRACLSGWYGLNAPGRIINTAALSCPFCRRKPNPRTLHKYGMGIHAVGDLAKAVQESGEWIYAWCMECGFAKQYMERVCARGLPPEIENWRCGDCYIPPRTRSTGDGDVKPCPGCGTMTEKIGGCDHIQCTGCGTHWCYFCGGMFPEKDIYRHMSEAHGGFFGGGDGDFEDEGWDTDDLVE